MLLFNIFTYKQHFLPILLQCIILILKSSPEILLNKFQKSQKNGTQITFIFSILQGTNNFRLIIIAIITVSFILCVYSIFSQKKGILGFQLISNLLFPIQVYLTVSSINMGSSNKLELFFLGLTFSISFIIILSKFLVFDFRTDSPVIVKAYGKWYQILSEVNMLFSAVMSFFLSENSKVTILIVLLVLALTKSYFLFYYITFESPLIEYAAYLCEPLIWLSLLTVLLTTIYGISTPLLLWGYLCFILLSIFFQNSVLRYLMQKKYIHFFRKQISFKANRNKQKVHDIENNLIIYLSLVKLGLKLKDLTVAEESFLRFSEHFVHQICTSIIRLEQVVLKKKPQKQNKQNSSSGQSSSQKNGVDLSLLLKKEFKFQNQHEYAQKYWAIIKEMKQLQDERFNNLRKYIFYSLPQITNAFQARIIYIYYLNRQNESKQTKEGKVWSKLNFIDDLQNQIDYNFVVEKSKNKGIQEMLVKAAKNSSGSVMVSDRSDNEYCLKTELVYGSAFFQDFYTQTLFQQVLEKQLQDFYHQQKQLIGVVASTHSTVDNLTQRLVKVHQVKSRIMKIIEQCPQVQTRQFLLQQYVLSKYVLKLPFLARDRLRQIEQQNDDRHMKQKIVLKSHNNQSNSVQRKKIQENQAVMMISSIGRKGNIIYGSSNFKQIMEIKQIQNLNTEDSHQYLHVNNFLLPCWVEPHNKVMESLMIYQRPFHHVGSKFHMKSIISKKVYEVEFTMSFITCSMDDLIIAVDLKYKKLDYLCISKNNEKVFVSNGTEGNYNRSRRSSMSTEVMSQNVSQQQHGEQQQQQHQQHQTSTITQKFDYTQKKRTRSYQQEIFDEKYQIVVKYSIDCTSQQTMLDIPTAQGQQHHKQKDQSTFKLKSSMTNFDYDRQQKRIQTEKKLYNYRKNHFLFSKDYIIVITIKVLMAMILLVLTCVLANLLIHQSDKHKEFYQFRHKIQNQYYLTDLKSFNSFLMLFVPISQYIKFPSNDSIIDFEKVWYKVFKEEISNLKSRGINLAVRPYDADYALRLTFKSLNGDIRSFLYQQEKFQIQYFNIINQLNLQAINNGNSSEFPNPQKDLNLAQSRLLDDLYLKSLVRYTQYLQPGGVFDSLQLLSEELIDDEYAKLKIIYSLLISVVLVGIVAFAILYIRYLNNLCYFTSSLFQLPQQTTTRLQTQLQDFKDFISVLFLSYSKQSKNVSQSELYKKIQSSKQISIKNKTVFIRKSQKNKKIKQIKNYSSLQANWKQVILLSLFLLMFFLFLYGSFVKANTEIDLMVNYMAGTLQLAQTSAKSINIFTWLIDGIFYINKPINPQIPLLIDQIKRVDLLRTMQKLQPNTVDIELSLFTSWYENNYMKLNFFDTLQAKRTLMETFTKSIHLYEIVYNKLSVGQRITIIDSKLIVQMYKEISHSTQMIRQLLNKSQSNYFNAVPTINIYLVLNILCNILFCAFILYFTHRRLYRQTKIIFEETLSLTKINDLILVPTLAYHFHQSQKQNIYRDSLEG